MPQSAAPVPRTPPRFISPLLSSKAEQPHGALGEPPRFIATWRDKNPPGQLAATKGLQKTASTQAAAVVQLSCTPAGQDASPPGSRNAAAQSLPGFRPDASEQLQEAGRKSGQRVQQQSSSPEAHKKSRLNLGQSCKRWLGLSV